jgi:membrane-bound serine protease (ClpP class)
MQELFKSLVAALVALALLAPAGAQATAGEGPARGEAAVRIVVVPVHGALGTPAVYLVRRGVRTAIDAAASRIVLDIDTPGGLVESMREIEGILAALRETEGIRTTAFVSHAAWSAGGYLALACDELFMAPGASIGAITPILVGPGGAEQIGDDDVRDKALSVFRADVRQLIANRGNASEEMLTIGEAMVDPRLEIFEVDVVEPNGLSRTRIVDQEGLRGLQSAGVRVEAQRSVGRGPLTLTADEALRHGFSKGTFASVAVLTREEFAAEPAQVLVLEPSWSESGVAWLEAIKPLLFVFGFILLLVELKAPGLALPGVLGVTLIVIGLFSSYLVGLADWTEILLFFLGLGLIGVEMFVMPGTIVFGLAGFLALLFALVLSQQTFVWPENASQRAILDANLLNLLYLILLVVAGTMLFYRLLPRIPFFSRALLALPERGATGDSTRFARPETGGVSALLGVVGVAVTDLRPSGVLERPDGSRVDVVSRGSFVPRGSRLRVVEVSGNRVVVDVEGADEGGAVSIGLLFLLIVVGLCLVVAEVFFISGGLLSIGAAVSLVAAIFLAFTQHSQAVGFTFLAMAAVGVPAALAFALRLLPKTSLGRKILLEAPSREWVQGAAQEAGLAELVGREGLTESVLRPAGFARIDGRRVDVVTRGELIETGRPIRVIQVEGNRVVVAELPASSPHS